MLEELGLLCWRARSHRVDDVAASPVGEGARVRSTHGTREWRCAGRRGRRVVRDARQGRTGQGLGGRLRNLENMLRAEQLNQTNLFERDPNV